MTTMPCVALEARSAPPDEPARARVAPRPGKCRPSPPESAGDATRPAGGASCPPTGLDAASVALWRPSRYSSSQISENWMELLAEVVPCTLSRANPSSPEGSTFGITRGPYAAYLKLPNATLYP